MTARGRCPSVRAGRRAASEAVRGRLDGKTVEWKAGMAVLALLFVPLCMCVFATEALGW
ncbi:hypothetical protein [Gordonibacter sp. Marseille-P4307]|uniref:hypothetical protein n=1 Tax=Gordonibacter sp. Marseille-P4307 TaxID=2161815 RepID=UPI0013DE3A0D|nr:hypothetical protein [Gordonibacter sp. Marseille-P4307]